MAWSNEEVEFLKINYETMPAKEIANRLGKTSPQIYYKAKKLGVNKSNTWGEEDKQFLLENYQNLSDKRIAECIGKSQYEVKNYRRKMGLRIYTWSRKDLKLLLKHDDMTNKELAKKLDRSFNQVKNLRRKLRVNGKIDKQRYEAYLKKNTPPEDKPKPRKQMEWSQKEIEFVESNCKKMSVGDIADRLGRTAHSVSNYYYSHGINSRSVRQYDLVKGDKILMTGTLDEIRAEYKLTDKQVKRMQEVDIPYGRPALYGSEE